MERIKGLVLGVVWFLVIASINGVVTNLIVGITFTGAAYLALRTAVFAIPSLVISVAILRMVGSLRLSALVCLVLMAVERATFQYEIFSLTAIGILNYAIDFLAVFLGMFCGWIIPVRNRQKQPVANGASDTSS